MIEKDWEDNRWYYLDTILEDTEYEHFEIGNEGYTGKRNDICIVLSGDLRVSDLEEKLEELSKFLKAKKICLDHDQKSILVGGIHEY
jgi:hypothetical protein